MPDDSDELAVNTSVHSNHYFRTRGCGCTGHPAFPTPSFGRNEQAYPGRNKPRECEGVPLNVIASPMTGSGSDLRCAIAHRGISRFSDVQLHIGVRIFDAPRNADFIHTAAGSPQAMNSGTMKSCCPLEPWRPFPNCNSAPCGSLTLPPAAVMMACPAAMSHSDVGASRG